MNSLDTGRVAETLKRLVEEAREADRAIMESFDSADTTPDQMIAGLIEAETNDLHGLYHAHAEHFLSVSPAFGRFLYLSARAMRARRIVEFGTSMGISTIYLAAALRDTGGGQLIGTEIEASKVTRARANLEAAGVADLVDIREGDARETLAKLDGEVDLVLLDGAFSLYLPVLKLLEPHFRTGTMIVAENAFEQAGGYLAYVRDPANGYCSQSLAISEGRGNELAVFTR